MDMLFLRRAPGWCPPWAPAPGLLKESSGLSIILLRGWVGSNRACGSAGTATSPPWSPEIVFRVIPGPWKWHCVGCQGVEDADGFSWLHFFHFLF